MRWSLSNPKAAEEIKAFEKFKQKVPDSLKPPKLHDIEFAIWSAFWDLSTERESGIDQGRIKWSSKRKYASTVGIEPNSFQKIINAMDEALLNHKTGSGGRKFTRDMLKR